MKPWGMLVVVLVLAGCSSGKTAASGPTSFAADKTGAAPSSAYPLYDVKWPAPADDPLLEKVEAYRAEAAGPAVTFVRVIVDNTKGAQEAVRPEVQALIGTSQVTLTDAGDSIFSWMNLDPSNTTTYNDGVSLENTYDGSRDVLAGAKSTLLYAMPAGKTDVAAVYINGHKVG